MADLAARRILTPDRRLRVFVSSTLQELAEERGAASEAIATLQMAPVLFELGAALGDGPFEAAYERGSSRDVAEV